MAIVRSRYGVNFDHPQTVFRDKSIPELCDVIVTYRERIHESGKKIFEGSDFQCRFPYGDPRRGEPLKQALDLILHASIQDSLSEEERRLAAIA